MIAQIHNLKTGKLIALPIELGALLAHADDKTISTLGDIGLKLGLAFQIADDILDVEGDEAELGKPIGSDEENQKSTYPALLGLAESKKLARQVIDESNAMLADLPYNTQIFQEIGSVPVTE